jgi:hypothetical protein
VEGVKHPATIDDAFRLAEEYMTSTRRPTTAADIPVLEAMLALLVTHGHSISLAARVVQGRLDEYRLASQCA